MSREERKVVTVLFTDLVGFTSRAEELDPEDVRALLAPYHARLREQIERRGGTVEKFIGDAVMAVFGAPVAHEDDPVRAVLAAIAIRDGSPGLELRTAVNTGEALVALDADASAGEALVSGDVVNTAARLQAAAPVNGILAGEATYRATRRVIEYLEAPAVEAKGKARPVSAWEVVAARPRHGSDVEQAARTALAGRERELGLLADAFARCRGEETAQLVTLVGVPGIGKSRLVAELFAVLDAQPEVVWWRQGRSLPYGESRSVWALGEIVKAQAGILDSDDARTAQEKLAAACDDPWVLSHLRPLAGVGGEIDESHDRRSEAFSAWRRFFETLAEERPLVLVFEDLHWADDTLLDFVDHLAEWVSGVPMLLVATARPELLDRRPGWGGGKRNAATLSIGALSDGDTAKLLPILPAETQRLVLARAGGNPLYAAEFARMLVERPGDDLPLPETVQGVIAARIDQLAPAEKAVVQEAAVLGKVFWPAALESASEEALHALERKEFVRRDRRSAVAGETQYAFQHLLVRDVAYGQIPRAARLERHLAAARWIAALAPDRSEDRAEMLAHHYREALLLAKASGVDASPFRAAAVAALADASEGAAALGSWNAAADLATEALALETRPELQLRLARAKAYGRNEFDVELAEAGLAGFEAAGDLAGAAEGEGLLSWLAWWQGDGHGARRHGARALELTRGLPASVPKARAHAQAARIEAIDGDPARAVELADEALAIADELGRDDLRSNALNSRGIARAHLRDAAALDDLARAVELADRANDPTEMAISRNNYGSVLTGHGRLGDVWALLEDGRAVAARFGISSAQQWVEMQMLMQRVFKGGWKPLLPAIDELAARVDAGSQIASGLEFVRGSVLGLRGETGEALRLLDGVVAAARRSGSPQMIAPAMSVRAVVLDTAGRRPEAEEALAEILGDPALATRAVFETLVLLADWGRAADWLAAADPAGESEWRAVAEALADGDWRAGAGRLADMGLPFLEAWARLAAAERGDLAQLEHARAFFAAEDAAPFLRRCEAVLRIGA